VVAVQEMFQVLVEQPQRTLAQTVDPHHTVREVPEVQAAPQVQAVRSLQQAAAAEVVAVERPVPHLPHQHPVAQEEMVPSGMRHTAPVEEEVVPDIHKEAAQRICQTAVLEDYTAAAAEAARSRTAQTLVSVLLGHKVSL